jgi:hypothetical protein
MIELAILLVSLKLIQCMGISLRTLILFSEKAVVNALLNFPVAEDGAGVSSIPY